MRPADAILARNLAFCEADQPRARSYPGKNVGHCTRPHHWRVSAMDVGDWLRKLGLEQYEPAFRANEIDARVLPSLTAEDLKDVRRREPRPAPPRSGTGGGSPTRAG